MKLIEPSVEIWEPTNLFESIARAARICYASESKSDAKQFVEKLIEKKHYRPLEFGTVYLCVPCSTLSSNNYLVNKFNGSPYSVVRWYLSDCYITTNYRFLYEHDLLDQVKAFFSPPMKHHAIRATIHWTISRAIADEFRTHVSLSSLMQSTRYCKYTSDKFGNEVTFIKPSWLSSCDPESLINEPESDFVKAFEKSEYFYAKLIQNYNLPAELARDILPLGIKTEMVQCGFLDTAWYNFFNQRVKGTTGKPHPDALYIATKAYNLIKEKYYGYSNSNS